ADHPALGSSLLGWAESTFFDHAGLQPLLDLLPGRKRAEMTEQSSMIDAVECLCQVGVKAPLAARVGTPRHLEDCLDRVLAAATWPEAIDLRLKSRLPLGFQRARHPCLLHAIEDHGNAEWAPLLIRFRDVHALDGLGTAGCAEASHPVGQHGLVGGSHHDLP